MLWFKSHFNRLAFNILDNFDLEQGPIITLIYGPPGTGKTELLRAIYKKFKNHTQVIYINADSFSKGYAYASQEDGLTNFRDKFRTTKLLLFDQLERLKGKARTIEEFLHTYEAIAANEGKIITAFTGDISELDFLGEKLTSRLLGGLSIPIESPSKSEILDYIHRYTRSRFLIIESEVLDQIAESVVNFSEAQIIIQGFIDFANKMDSALNINAFRQYLVYRDKIIDKTPTPQTIIKRVAELTGIEEKDITGSLRRTKITEARQLAMYMIRELCQLSYPEIGGYFNRTHSTVIKSSKNIEQLLKTDEGLRQKVDDINKYFQSN